MTVQCKRMSALHYNHCVSLHLCDLQENTFCYQAFWFGFCFFFLFRKSDFTSLLNDDCSQTGKGEQLWVQQKLKLWGPFNFIFSMKQFPF